MPVKKIVQKYEFSKTNLVKYHKKNPDLSKASLNGFA